jgi:hypothetical protein
MLARQRSIENGVDFLKKRPGFARAQAQAMRRGKELLDGLSEQEKLLASPQRLQAVLRLIDIRIEPYLSLVDDMASQEAFMAMVNGITDQAWQDYVGFSVYQAPPMGEDPNYRSITDRGWHWVAEGYERVDAKEKEAAQERAGRLTETPGKSTVFISYSWDNDAHIGWVLELASRLKADGVRVLLDRFDLKFGHSTTRYMETSVTESDFVLVICTETYKKRFDNREGGAGYEGHIITSEIIEEVGNGKFIPVLRTGDWKVSMPTALKGIYGADFRNDSPERYRELVDHLKGQMPTHEAGQSLTSGQRMTPIPTATAAPREVDSAQLSPHDVILIATKRGTNLDVWLQNETLEPIARCSITLTNLQEYSEKRREFRRNPFKPIPLIHPHTVLAGGSTREAAALAHFRNTNKRELDMAGSASFTSAITLMAEIMIETETGSRVEVRFIKWTPGEDPEFVDDPRIVTRETLTMPTFITPMEYGEQRIALPESAVIKKIWARPRWCIWSRPEEFKKARFRDLDHCAQFVASASVNSRARWTQYPWAATTPDHGKESIASEVELDDGSIKHLERWVLFRSGQFVHNLALDEMPAISGRTHVLEILNTTTALFEFIGRMADGRIISGRTGISFEFHNVEGRQLTWPKDPSQQDDFVDRRSSWCQEGAFNIDNPYSSADLIKRRRDLAMEVALMIYSKFGWNDPPLEELRKAQQEKFGPPIHL